MDAGDVAWGEGSMIGAGEVLPAGIVIATVGAVEGADSGDRERGEVVGGVIAVVSVEGM